MERTYHKVLLSVLALLWLLPVDADETPSANQALIDSAAGLIQSGQLDEAARLDLQIVARLADEKDLGIHVNVYNDLGVIYRRRNMNDSALYYYQKALDAAVTLNDKEWLTTLAINLAVFNHNLQYFQDAERYADMGVKYSRQQEDESLRFLAYQVASPIKNAVEKYDDALRYAREAWQMVVGEDGSDDLRLRCITALASAFDGMGQTDSVFHYINLGGRLLEGCDNDITRIGFVQCRSEMYFRHQRWRDALRDMLVLASSSGTLNAPLFRKIAECCRHLGDYDRAFCYMDTARMWTDSLAAKGIKEKLAEFNVKYEAKEKEMLLAEERSEHASQRLRWLVIILVAVLLIAVLIVVLLVVRHRHRLHLMFVCQCAELNEARQYIEGLETERARMARELHDSISNGLLGVSLKMQGAQTPDEIHAVLDDVEHLRNEVRTLSHGMMPPEFSRHTLPELLRHYTEGLRDTPVHFYVHDDACWKQLPAEVAFEVFRIAQECISNALAHAGAGSITLSLAVAEGGEQGILLVEDDGTPGKSTPESQGIGTRVMQERVKTIGGSLEIKTHEKGTSVSLIFPI